MFRNQLKTEKFKNTNCFGVQFLNKHYFMKLPENRTKQIQNDNCMCNKSLGNTLKIG